MAENETRLDGNGGYWRSLQELAGTEEFRRSLLAEFPEGEPAPGELPRRRFLQLMGASLALAGLAGCRWPQEKIVPFAHRPEDYVPGQTKRYATTLEIAGMISPVLVTSYDGRPIKVEGNPAHPFSLGATDVFAQASVLGLYDPDRSQNVVRRSGRQTIRAAWSDFAAFGADHFGRLRRTGGTGLAVLSEASSSFGRATLRTRFRQAFPRSRWYEYEPVSRDNEREGTALLYGHPLRAQLALEKARIIVALDSELLRDHPSALRNARQLADGRSPDPARMNRLYACESATSLTGAVADHRLALPCQYVPWVGLLLAAELFGARRLPLPAGFEDFRRLGPWADGLREDPDLPAPLRDLPARIRPWLDDLLAHRGSSLITVGPRQPAELHALALLMNEALGNVGETVTLTEDLDPDRLSHQQAMVACATDLRRGNIDTLLILGGNPVYDAPVDLALGDLLPKVATSVHLSLQDDETSRLCSWHLPRAHPLEAWDDLRAPDGTFCASQPLIAPLYDGRTVAEVLSLLIDETPLTAYEMVQRAFHEHGGGEGPPPVDAEAFQKRWRKFLHDGFVEGSAAAPATARPLAREGLWHAILLALGSRRETLGPDHLELVFAADARVHDGRFANNAWLQELPDFVTKLTWDNAALLSPATAAEMKVKDGDVVTLHYRERDLELPVAIIPGQARYSVTVSLGYGRTACGRVGAGVGGDTYRLRTSDTPWGGTGLTMTRAGRTHLLATTQDHFAIDTLGAREREQRIGPLIREGSLAEYQGRPDFAQHLGEHHPPLVSLWKEHPYEGHRWGMTIDLNRCIGCNACVVACVAENNIPVVGKKQVSKGREMYWLRLDRYWRGDPDDPRIAFQPVACVQCENAPCEQVCPVAATLHSDEGLNLMVYNRCVGTRYCSNNCPYKVRRFNFFNYRKHLTDTQKMAYNPEVTVRSRGVMEKCTYCIQRIEAGKITAKNEHRPLRDGDITPACAQACPTQAIVFGDLNDTGSRVSRLQADPRAYKMLAELNVKPRTAYLARIRNPHPDLEPGAEEQGKHLPGSSDENGR